MGAGKTNRPAFGVLLRQLRQAAELTQEKLADQSDISTRAISDLERGFRQHSRQDTAQLLAEAPWTGAGSATTLCHL